MQLNDKVFDRVTSGALIAAFVSLPLTVQLESQIDKSISYKPGLLSPDALQHKQRCDSCCCSTKDADGDQPDIQPESLLTRSHIVPSQICNKSLTGTLSSGQSSSSSIAKDHFWPPSVTCFNRCCSPDLRNLLASNVSDHLPCCRAKQSAWPSALHHHLDHSTMKAISW